jgi:hypothetical protein
MITAERLIDFKRCNFWGTFRYSRHHLLRRRRWDGSMRCRCLCFLRKQRSATCSCQQIQLVHPVNHRMHHHGSRVRDGCRMAASSDPPVQETAHCSPMVSASFSFTRHHPPLALPTYLALCCCDVPDSKCPAISKIEKVFKIIRLYNCG